MATEGARFRRLKAFSLQTIVDGLGKQTASLCVWRDKLLLGLNDGSMCLMTPPALDAPAARWTAVSTIKGISSVAIPAIQTLAEKDILIAITHEGVNQYTLPRFNLIGQAANSKGAVCFAWQDGSGLLAVALRRKVQLYKYSNREMVPQRAFSVPDVTVMHWCGPSSLCVASKKRFTFLNPATGSATEVPGTLPGTPPCIVPCGEGELMLLQEAVGRFYAPHAKPLHRQEVLWGGPPTGGIFSEPYCLLATPSMLEARNVGPAANAGIVQKLPADTTHLVMAPTTGADGSAFLVTGGHVARAAPVGWEAQAASLAALGEFGDALGLCDNMPDSAGKQRLMDALRIRYGRELCRAGQFGLGLAQFGMCARRHPGVLLSLFPSLVPAPLLRDLEDLEGLECVAAEGGVGGRISGGDDPEGAADDITEPVGEDILYTVMTYLYSHRSHLMALQAARAEGGGPPGEPASPGPADSREGGPDRSAGTAQVQSDAARGGERPDGGEGGVEPATSQGADAGVGKHLLPAEEASDVLRGLSEGQQQRLLVVVDTAMCKTLLQLPDRGELLSFLQRPHHVDWGEGEAVLAAAGRYAELVALYRSAGRHHDALRLLERLSADPEAMDPPAVGAAADLGGRTGVWAGLRYVVGMGASHSDLIQQCAAWMLSGDPEAALEALLSMRPPLPTATMLHILRGSPPAFTTQYLETALELGTAPPEEAHSALLELYLTAAAAVEQRLGPAHTRRSRRAPQLSEGLITSHVGGLVHARDWSRLFPDPSQARSYTRFSQQGEGSSPDGHGAGAAAQAPAPPQAEGDTPLSPEDLAGLAAHAKLMCLVSTSPHVKAATLLKQLPPAGLTEIKALLLERLGEHAAALRVYVHDLNDAELAEAYCDRVYDAERGSSPDRSVAARLSIAAAQGRPRHAGDIYLALLEAYLQGPLSAAAAAAEVPLPLWEQLAALLSRKVDRLDTAAALGLVHLHGTELPLRVMGPFLHACLSSKTRQERESCVEMHLRRTQNLQALEALDCVRQSYVVMIDTRACCVCNKRIGNAVFLRMPDESLQHYSCHRGLSAVSSRLGKAG